MTSEVGLAPTSGVFFVLIFSISTRPPQISADADEQDVADIFVRVNSGGQTLMENNFIQTLISVYEKDVHDNITSFCEQSRIPKDGTSYNHIMEVDPQHLVRMAVGLGFHRAWLRYAYMLLRGKDLETGQYSDSTRTDNLQKFKDALDEVMNLNNWHTFINCVKAAGYVSNKIIALPEDFENKEYLKFLSERRILMANIIRDGYKRLS